MNISKDVCQHGRSKGGKDYVAAFHPKLIGLTGTPRQLASVAEGFRARYLKSEDAGEGGYSMSHTTSIYLIGTD